MFLKTITFTGADDSVNPEALLELSKEHPFIEWGILLSQSRMGTPRYPSLPWLERLQEIQAKNPDLNLSAHFCGKWVRDIVKGDLSFPHTKLLSMFKRVQFNFAGNSLTIIWNSFLEVVRTFPAEVIFQVDEKSKEIYEFSRKNFIKTYPLFDSSSGNGVLPNSWPSPYPDTYCGYAGGLGPENLEEQLNSISSVAGDATVWVDMERRIRSSIDSFDFEKVKICSNKAEKWTKNTQEQLLCSSTQG